MRLAVSAAGPCLLVRERRCCTFSSLNLSNNKSQGKGSDRPGGDSQDRGRGCGRRREDEVVPRGTQKPANFQFRLFHADVPASNCISDRSPMAPLPQAELRRQRDEAESATSALSRRVAELEAELEAQKGAAAAGAAQAVRSVSMHFTGALLL